MNFTVTKETLLSKVQLAAAVVGNKNILPILGYLLFDVKDNILDISATNGAQGVQSSCEVRSDADGKFTVPAKRIVALLNSLPDSADVLVSATNGKVNIASGSSAFTLLSLPAEDFPFIFPDISKRTVRITSPAHLAKVISLCKNAVCKDDGRPLLTGLLLDYTASGLTACTTDGKRLTIVEQDGSGEEPCQAVIPGIALPLLSRLSGEVAEIFIDDKNIVVKAENMSVISKLISGKYPNYRQVVPQTYTHKFSFDAEELCAAVKQISILTDVEQAVEMRFDNGNVTISVQESSVGSGSVTVTGDCSVTEPLVLKINYRYLLDAMVGCRQTVTIKINSEIHPVCIECDAESYTILMPIRAR